MFFSKKDSDYVSRVKYFKPEYLEGKKEVDFSSEDLEIYSLIKDVMIPRSESFEYFGKITEEMFLEIVDMDLKFHISIKDGKANIKIGWDKNIHPTIVVPLKKINVLNFNKILEDGRFDDEEIQRVIHVLTLPALKSFYHSEMINNLKDVSILKLHKLLHVEVTNPNSYKINGELISTKATIMSVMGQFIILPGHVGIAPVNFTVTPLEGIQYYELLRYKLPNAKSVVDKTKLFKEYMDLRSKTVFKNPNYK